MASINSRELDALAPSEAVDVLCRRFSWLNSDKAFLKRCIEWQEKATPRPNFYLRWHLPRLVATLHAMKPALERQPDARVLDIATFAPFAIAMEEQCKQNSWCPAWTRTSLDGKTESFTLGGQIVAIPTVPLELNEEAKFPFDNETFDFVIFNETIEHLRCHPQYILKEINRVLKVGGTVLITTPNAAGWKKIVQLSNGVLEFDSPTWGDEWGHRFEYSMYNLRKMLTQVGFEAVDEMTRDIYLDDPRGAGSAIFFAGVLGGKILSGNLRKAARLWKFRGSGLLFLYRKVQSSDLLSPEQFLVI